MAHVVFWKATASAAAPRQATRVRAAASVRYGSGPIFHFPLTLGRLTPCALLSLVSLQRAGMSRRTPEGGPEYRVTPKGWTAPRFSQLRASLVDDDQDLETQPLLDRDEPRLADTNGYLVLPPFVQPKPRDTYPQPVRRRGAPHSEVSSLLEIFSPYNVQRLEKSGILGCGRM